MSKSLILTGLVLLLLLASACSPVSTPPPPTPIVTENPPVAGVAVVQSVEIQILESDPVQVNANVRGQLPDAGCTTVSSVSQVREGNTIKVTLGTTTDPLAQCAQALTPFEQVVPLDISNLPPAQYIVNVNGVEQSFGLLTRDVSKFQQVLVDGLNARNYDLLKLLMGESLMIGYWQSEGTTNSPEAAVELFEASLLSSSAAIAADPRMNLIELLGTDPVTIVGSEVAEVRPLFTAGWGPEGKDEAILFTAQQPNGSPYWYGLLFAKDGFKKLIPDTSSNPPATPVPGNQPAPQRELVPTISILEVVKDSTVTIRTHDYPVNVNFKVRMGFMGTKGIDGFVVDTLNSRNGGSITLTFEIPQRLHGEKQIAIRLESEEGYYSYNWFDNTSTWSASGSTDSLPTNVKYVMARQDISIYSGPSKNYSIIGSIADGQVVKVTGVSLDGNWWRVLCPNSTVGNCWVLAKHKFTEPTEGP